MTGPTSPRAGKALDPSLLLDVPRLLAAYFSAVPDPAIPAQRVIFGTSGHRGSAASFGRPLFDARVGFKWFVDGLFDGSLGFAGEESAGASFLRHGGSVWTTDKDGLILGLLAAEMTARTGIDPSVGYEMLTREMGISYFERIDAPATPEQKAILTGISAGQAGLTTLAGETVRATFTEAPGNGAPIGGVKSVTEGGWFAARPSGTEHTYKIYAESFRSEVHLRQIQQESRDVIARLFAAGRLGNCRFPSLTATGRPT